MNFAQKISAGAKKHMAVLQGMYNQQVKAAEDRAAKKMARARTKVEKEQAKAQLAQEKLKLKRQLYEARTATRKAKTAMERARKEAGDLTPGERLSQVYKSLTKQPKRKPTRRKTAKTTKTAKKR